jgi:hypothetical protein
MLYGADIVVCSEINTKQINTVWAQAIILKCYKNVGACQSKF